ncbi:universal stress protein [Brachybacterium sp. MASK1Z-5]|uniref:Universal stress protein n=1 Tax=Brachybacterium halotolerans TaxID=2795215 RepID=A0ABS1B5G2_9MICO|nr:universal stress protein [Brachybacterium halotolerans]MBK0329865.1 universal stress protein [Brachybacterium halotolerans]
MSVVVGYSPSAQGDAALAAAAREAKRGGDTLVVASHAYHDPEAGRAIADAESVGAAIDALGIAEPPQVEVRTGEDLDVGDFLLQVVHETDARLIVIGLRRKSRIGKLNLGASARRVVLESTCPVLAVKHADAIAA